ALCLFNFSDNPVVVAAAEFLAPPNAPEVLSQTCQRGAGALGEVLTGSYQLCFSVDAEGGQASDSAAALGTRS
ncbi:MAG TPA: hypothetical protein DCY85_09515, partial [Firmicutes bacterium]|nr:hypothetical protein [Bacillota bacterium]